MENIGARQMIADAEKQLPDPNTYHLLSCAIVAQVGGVNYLEAPGPDNTPASFLIVFRRYEVGRDKWEWRLHRFG